MASIIRVILTTCYSWFSHMLHIRKVGIDVNTLLVTCMFSTGRDRHTSSSEALVKTLSDKLTLYSINYYLRYSIIPTLYDCPVNSTARMRTASLRATDTIAFFFFPELHQTELNLDNNTGSYFLALQAHCISQART